MDSADSPLPTAVKWASRVALAIGCLALLFCFVNPLVAIFQSGLCFAFAFGIRRRRAWAAIGGAGFWLIPVAILLLSGNGLTADLLVTIAMSLAVGLLMLWAAGTLWREPAARSGSAPWIAFLVLFGIGFVCFQPFRVPTGAMEPTILNGDNFFAEKATWKLGRTPKRGEIVAFHYPIDPKQTYIKRVVGLPGDRISMRQKQLIRNDVVVVEPWAVHMSSYLDSYRDNFPSDPNVQLPEPALEMLRSNLKDGQVVVPPDSYFVLGDNRDSSLDSRYWGFLRRSDIIGAPVLIYASYKQGEGTSSPAATPTILDMRWNRLLKLL